MPKLKNKQEKSYFVSVTIGITLPLLYIYLGIGEVNSKDKILSSAI